MPSLKTGVTANWFSYMLPGNGDTGCATLFNQLLFVLVTMTSLAHVTVPEGSVKVSWNV